MSWLALNLRIWEMEDENFFFFLNEHGFDCSTCSGGARTGPWAAYLLEGRYQFAVFLQVLRGYLKGADVIQRVQALFHVLVEPQGRESNK